LADPVRRGVLLATQIAAHVDFRERILARPWAGPDDDRRVVRVRSGMEQRILDTLLSDYLPPITATPGKTVNAYVAYNESQRKGSRAIPHRCACRAAAGSSRIGDGRLPDAGP
jgi:hypothetical protein